MCVFVLLSHWYWLSLYTSFLYLQKRKEEEILHSETPKFPCLKAEKQKITYFYKIDASPWWITRGIFWSWYLIYWRVETPNPISSYYHLRINNLNFVFGLSTGWNANRETENTAFGYIKITCWIHSCWWTLWFYCGTWRERTRCPHVS